MRGICGNDTEIGCRQDYEVDAAFYAAISAEVTSRQLYLVSLYQGYGGYSCETIVISFMQLGYDYVLGRMVD